VHSTSGATSGWRLEVAPWGLPQYRASARLRRTLRSTPTQCWPSSAQADGRPAAPLPRFPSRDACWQSIGGPPPIWNGSLIITLQGPR